MTLTTAGHGSLDTHVGFSSVKLFTEVELLQIYNGEPGIFL